MKLVLMYFLFNLLQCSKGFTPKEYMVELNDTNFDEKIKIFDSAIVVYYTNHDNLLQFLESDNEIDLSNDEPIYFVYVDCNKSGKHICMKYGISDSLDINIFHNGIRSSHYRGPAVKSCAMKYLMTEKQPSYKELDDDNLQEFISPQNNISILGCFKRNSKLRTAFTDVAKDLKHVYNFGIVKQFELDKKNYEDDIILFRPTYLTNKYEKDYIVYEGGSGTDEINRYISKNKHGLVKILRNDIYHVITYPMTIVYFDVDLHNPHGLSYCRTQVLRVAKQFYNRMNFAISEKLNADEDITYPHVVMKFDDNEVFVMKQFFSSQNLENFVTGMLKMMEEWEKHPDRSMSEWQMNV